MRENSDKCNRSFGFRVVETFMLLNFLIVKVRCKRVVFYCLFFRVQSIRIQVSRTQPGGFLEQDTSQTINKDAR